jgi:ribonuclease HI
MEMITAIPPLSLKIKEIALMARIRSQKVVPVTWDGETHQICKGHLLWLDNFINESLPDNFTIDRTFCINTFRSNSINITGKFEIDFGDVLNIFTDASVVKNTAGAVWTIYVGTRLIHSDNIHLGENISVFQGEIIAIYLATCWIINNNYDSEFKKINFYSDSQKALSAIDFWSVDSLTVQTCTNELSKLSNIITLTWIPAHSGIIGNEDADAEASIGRLSDPPDNIRKWPIQLNCAKSMIKSALHCEWQLLIDNTAISHTKKFFTTINFNKRYKRDILQLSRSQLNTVMAWVTGHCNLKYHLKRIGLSKSKRSRLCKSRIETPDHILRYCPKTKDSRIEVEYAYQKSRYKSRDMIWRPGFNPSFQCSKPNMDLFNYILRIHVETSTDLNNDLI